MNGQRGGVTKGTENHNGHKGFLRIQDTTHYILITEYGLLLTDYPLTGLELVARLPTFFPDPWHNFLADGISFRVYKKPVAGTRPFKKIGDLYNPSLPLCLNP